MAESLRVLNHYCIVAAEVEAADEESGVLSESDLTIGSDTDLKSSVHLPFSEMLE